MFVAILLKVLKKKETERKDQCIIGNFCYSHHRFMWINFNQSIIYSVCCVFTFEAPACSSSFFRFFFSVAFFFPSPLNFSCEFFAQWNFALAWRRWLKKRHRAPPNPVLFFFFLSNNLILLFVHWRHNMRAN